MIHHETNRAPYGRHDDDRIDKADMVAYEYGGAGSWDVLKARLADPVERVDQQPCQETQSQMCFVAIGSGCNEKTAERQDGEDRN